jgi:hypothetical protein
MIRSTTVYFTPLKRFGRANAHDFTRGGKQSGGT